MEQRALQFIEVRDEISDAEILRRCPDFRAALRFCVDVAKGAGMCPKEIAFELGIEASHFSRMVDPVAAEGSKKHFPPELVPMLMSVCQNQIPLRWLALTAGYGLHKLKSKLEEENDTLRRQLAEQETKLSAITEFMRSVRGAA